MGIPHKALQFKYIVAFMGVFLLGFAALTARADDSLYTVEGITVDVTAESSVAAQQKAFEEAQVKAFESLAQRMVQPGQTGGIPKPDLNTIAAMVKDFEVTNERLTAVRYVGTYTFRFRERDVTEFFSLSGVAYTDKPSKPLLVLPFLQAGNKTVLWADNNLWMEAWSRAQFAPALVPVEVPIGELMDVGDIDDSQGLNYDVSRLGNMLSRYNASDAAVMIAMPDDALAKVASDTEVARGAMQISIYRTDRGAPEFVRSLSVVADGTETRAKMFDRAVQTGYQALQTDWKAKTGSSSANSGNYQVQVPFANLKDWLRIKNILETVPGLDAINVLAMSPKFAKVGLDFRGDEMRLRDMLAQAGMSLEPADAKGVYTLLVDVPPQGGNTYYTPPVAAPSQPQPQPAVPNTNTFYTPPPAEPDTQEIDMPPPPAVDNDMVQTF